MTFTRLGEYIGQSRTTAFYWFERYHHRPLLAFLCWIERLPAHERHAFLDKYCRIFPHLEHALIAHAPSKVQKLRTLLNGSRSLTIVTGSEWARGFVIHAIGNAFQARSPKRHRLAGIDLHRPTRFVPLESCSYFDGNLGFDLIRSAVLNAWPRIQTSSAATLVLNGVWAIEELRPDILKLAERRHVLLGASEPPDFAIIRRTVSSPVHLLTLAGPQTAEGKIRINCRRIKPLKSSKKAPAC